LGGVGEIRRTEGLAGLPADVKAFPASVGWRLAACRTHEINGQILKQMESTSAFSATKFLLAGNFDSFVSLFG
jgi:hypothetical protein